MKDATKPHLWPGSGKLARTSVAVLLGGILIASAAGCAGNKTETSEKPTEERTTTVTQGGAESGGTRAQEAILEIKGDPGTEFSGSCTVGDEEKKISGQAPERFVYELGGQRLGCEIRKDSAGGNLQLVFTAGGNTRAVQQISGGTINLTYDNGLISFSSSGSGGQVSSSSSNSSSSVQQVVSSSSSQNNSSSISISSP